MDLLPANLAALASLAATERTRYSMTGVQVHFDHDGTYTAVATDGRYMGIATGPVPDASEYPAPPAVTSAPNTATDAVIPVREWKEAFKALPKARHCRGERCHLMSEYLVAVPNEKTTLLASTDGSKHTLADVQNVEGRFPDWKQVIPNDAPVATVDVDPRMLRELLQVAEKFATKDNQRVTIELRADMNRSVPCAHPVVLRVKGADGQQFTGLIMPLG